MDPALHPFTHGLHEFTGVHGKVPDELEPRQGQQFYLTIGKLGGEGTAGQIRLAIDDHGAGAADSGPADKVELKAGILLFPDFVQGYEDGHTRGFLYLIGLEPGSIPFDLGIVPHYLNL